MKINFDQTLNNLNGTPAMDEARNPLTLRTFVATMCGTQTDKEMSDEDKMTRGALAMRIMNAKEPLELTAAEIVHCQKAIMASHLLFIIAQANEMLEGNTGKLEN